MKKNGFLTFILSLIPGCGLMYLGYMKKGLQMMLMFIATCFLSFSGDYMIRADWIVVFFICLAVVIWFYQLFDSMHSISRMKRLEMEVPTDDGFFFPNELGFLAPVKNRVAARVIAYILIIIGVSGLGFALLDNLYYVFDHETARLITNAVRNYLIPAIVSIALIVMGVRLLKGGKQKDAAAHNAKDKE